MFTGIISDIGVVTQVKHGAATRTFSIACSYAMESIALGASIACNGACLTVTAVGPHAQGAEFTVDVSPETLDKTLLGAWVVGTRINLERALKMGDELGGHMVTGHVDAVGAVKSITEIDGNWQVWFTAPKDLMRFIAPKGSITIDGVSLTVNEMRDEDTSFHVNIVPHTLTHTIIGGYQQGQQVHLEIDVIARYVMRSVKC